MMDGMQLAIHVDNNVWDIVPIFKYATYSPEMKIIWSKENISNFYHNLFDADPGSHEIKPLNSTCNVVYSEQAHPRDFVLQCGDHFKTLNVPMKHTTKKVRRKWDLKLRLNGLILSLFVAELRSSFIYRNYVIEHFLKHARRNSVRTDLYVYINLVEVEKEVLDYAWNERIERMVIERRELDHAMSWFSTLGGAFSALGEQFTFCAEMAGKISVRQFQIALRLGDPLTVSRCKLYLALSFLQLGYLKQAREMIVAEYRFATSLPPEICDQRLIRMCHGIWAKLQYLHHQRRLKKYELTMKLGRANVEP